MVRQVQDERGRVLQLECHGETPARSVTAVQVEFSVVNGDRLELRYAVFGTSRLVLPTWTRRSRADELWRTTCCELFAREVGASRYLEFNFSPTGQWQCYAFEDYRASMRAIPTPHEPDIAREGGADPFVLTASLPRSLMMRGPVQLGLSAVIEETDGTKSYWALAHPTGPPDFHDPACFVLDLPSASAA